MENENLRKILFVDDEQNILSGLKRMLRSMRKELDMHFVDSGPAALELMETEIFDVIVSDMRMPGMDGAQLLSEVKVHYPHTIRIILTGQADEEAILRTIGITHQFLAKPCDLEVLKTVIRRSCSLHTLLVDEELKRVISGIGRLPSLPGLYNRLQEALRKPEVTADEIGEIIESDIAMSAKILQLANSSFFGVLKSVETPARAVKLLGLDTVKVLVLSLEVFSEFDSDEETIMTIHDLYDHSVMVAHCAKLIAQAATNDEEIITNSFIAGLLHDIGRLVLISKMGDQYREVITYAQDQEITLFEAENRVLQASHAEVGAYLVGLWGFNGSVIEAVGFQGRLGDYPGASFNAALAVHVANIAYYHHKQDEIIGSSVVLNEDYLSLNTTSEQVEKWLSLCGDYLESVE